MLIVFDPSSNRRVEDITMRLRQLHGLNVINHAYSYEKSSGRDDEGRLFDKLYEGCRTFLPVLASIPTQQHWIFFALGLAYGRNIPAALLVVEKYAPPLFSENFPLIANNRDLDIFARRVAPAYLERNNIRSWSSRDFNRSLVRALGRRSYASSQS